MSLSKDAKNAKQGSILIGKFRLNTELTHISVTQMLQDPSNRDEEGVMINEVISKAAGIEGQGFDSDKVRVVLVQMPLEKHKRDIIFAKNREWRAQDVRYPEFDENLIDYSILGGNHLVVGMQMIRAETRCPSFCSVKQPDGSGPRMSISLLTSMDADFASAVTGKIPCVVLRREVRDEPGALQSIQVSENQTHVLNTLESDKQCMLRCATWCHDGTLERIGEFCLKEQLKKEFPHLSAHTDGYFSWCQQMGGLESPHFKHWKHCDTRFTDASCTLRGTLMSRIASLPPTVPYVKRSIALAARQFMCIRVMEACGHICMYVCM
jgi:hypothetical protein